MTEAVELDSGAGAEAIRGSAIITIVTIFIITMITVIALVTILSLITYYSYYYYTIIVSIQFSYFGCRGRGSGCRAIGGPGERGPVGGFPISRGSLKGDTKGF